MFKAAAEHVTVTVCLLSLLTPPLGLSLQTFRPSALDFSSLPLPVHHGHAVAQLCQPRHRARAAHQDAGRPNTRTPVNARTGTVGVVCSRLTLLLLFVSLSAEHQWRQRVPG